jgi:parvulin-like peptidyl-prolyl isomerase
MTVWDAPNQQVVREDTSAPWDEGTGGTPGATAEELAQQQLAQAEAEEADLDSMTKDQLLSYAQSRGISPANASMTKDEIRQSIEDAES